MCNMCLVVIVKNKLTKTIAIRYANLTYGEPHIFPSQDSASLER